MHPARIRRLVAALIVSATLALVPATSSGQDSLSAGLRDAERQLDDGRSTLDESTLLAARQSFQACAKADTTKARCLVDLTRTDIYLVQAKERQHDTRGAQRAIDSGLDDGRRAIALDDRSAEAHALLGDLYGRKIGYSGMLGGMRYGPKAEAEVKRALQLDSTNVQAYLVLGRRYLYAPKMFGGDVGKAIDSFHKATTLDPHSDEAFVWLAMAYAKKGDAAAERAALDEALRLNGRNVVATEMRAALKDGDSGRST